MISSYDFTLSAENGAVISYDCAYRLYAWLLSHLTEEQGDALHEQGEHPVSQYLHTDRATGKTVWHISLLDELAHDLFCPVLDSLETIELHSGILSVQGKEHLPAAEPRELILQGRERNVTRQTLLLRSPVSFRQAKQYVLFPQEKLIVQSLVKQWNRFCPEYPLTDPDALQMLTEGISISDYSMRSARFRLKEALVPCFVGNFTLTARLSPPMAELWGALLCWSEYCGLGIKTTLGMGGVVLQEPGKAIK